MLTHFNREQKGRSGVRPDAPSFRPTSERTFLVSSRDTYFAILLLIRLMGATTDFLT